MIKAVLFDLDGTLLDTNELILTSFREAFKKVLNIQPPDEELTMLFGTPLVKSLIPYTEDKVDELVTTYRKLNDERHDEMCCAFTGVKEMLSELKKFGIKLGIVTAKREILTRRGMKIAGILDLFDVIITPELTEKHKPEPDPAIKACSLLGVDTNETVMVGDTTYDILCGKNAGCKTIAVKYTIIPLDKLKSVDPDYLVEKPIDIVEIIKELNENIA